MSITSAVGRRGNVLAAVIEAEDSTEVGVQSVGGTKSGDPIGGGVRVEIVGEEDGFGRSIGVDNLDRSRALGANCVFTTAGRSDINPGNFIAFDETIFDRKNADVGALHAGLKGDD